MLPFTIGALLALTVGAFATLLGLDRDRAMYPVVLIVIGALYSLFAVIGGSTGALLVEIGVGAVFMVLAAAGFRRSLWLVVAGLAAHGVFDWVHPGVYANPGVPAWWPSFCLAYDVVAAGYLGWLLLAGRVSAGPAGGSLPPGPTR